MRGLGQARFLAQAAPMEGAAPGAARCATRPGTPRGHGRSAAPGRELLDPGRLAARSPVCRSSALEARLGQLPGGPGRPRRPGPAIQPLISRSGCRAIQREGAGRLEPHAQRVGAPGALRSRPAARAGPTASPDLRTDEPAPSTAPGGDRPGLRAARCAAFGNTSTLAREGGGAAGVPEELHQAGRCAGRHSA